MIQFLVVNIIEVYCIDAKYCILYPITIEITGECDVCLYVYEISGIYLPFGLLSRPSGVARYF